MTIGHSGRWRVLHVLHHPPYGTLGGIELHVRDLTQEMGDLENFCAYPEEGRLQAVPIVRGAPLPPVFRGQGNDAAAFAALLDAVRPDLAHVHHVSAIGPEIVWLCRERGVRVVLSAHDAGVLHGYGEDGLPLAEGAPGGGAWRTRMRAAVDAADAVVCPSAYLERGVLETYGARSIRVIEHGLRRRALRPAAPASRALVCFPGASHDAAKGRERIADTALALAARGIRSLFLGTEAHGMPERLSACPAVSFGGFYERDELPAMLREAGVSLCCILPTHPEGYGYTLTECWAARLPAAVSAEGGSIAQRVRASGAGTVCPPGDPVVLAAHVAAFLASPAYDAALTAAKIVHVPTVPAMGRAYLRLYDDLLGGGAQLRARRLRQRGTRALRRLAFFLASA